MERAFFYVDGNPLNGVLVELDDTTGEDDILAALADAGFIPRDDDGEPQYDGNILVADVEGDLAPEFLGRGGAFNLNDFTDAANYCERKCVPTGAVAAYIQDRGRWDAGDFEDAYVGEYGSEKEFAQELFDDVYAHETPEFIAQYIDWEAFARDVFLSDYNYLNGYVFRNI